jgi:beta-barrel assembly-enhancing protease
MMRRLSLMLVMLCALSAPDARAISATDLATRDGEVAFGEAWLRSMRGRLGERIDPFCIDLLETWLIRLRNHYPLGEMPLKGLCLSPQAFNAFAAPGGIIGVNAGVYLDLATEAEIMAVLAHELAHLSQRHHYRGLRNSERVSVGSLATLAGIVAAIATKQGQAAQSLIIGGQAATAQSALAYSRDYEREADRIGAQALAAAGYDPEAMRNVLGILAEKQSQLTEDLAFLSTHPLGIERQSDLDARLARLNTPNSAIPILSDADFQLFRCVQIEGFETTGRLLESDLCRQVHAVLAHYRADRYQDAYSTYQTISDAYRSTLTGLDLTMALAIKAGDFDAARDAIETFALFFPSWITPTIGRMDLALAEGDTTLPRQFREAVVSRPDRIDLWRALARFAESTRQNHLLFEARSWDALMHGKLEAAKTQLTRARDVWPKQQDTRPLQRLEAAITAVETG